MADKMRWRYGDTNPVVAAVDADTIIEIGDLLWLDGDDAKPASALRRDYPSESLQEVFSGSFLGVAMQRSLAGETYPVRVATTGVFEMDCRTARFELGNLIGPAPDGDALANQRCEQVDCGDLAIGRVARRAPAGTESVLVDIRSTVMTGGVIEH